MSNRITVNDLEKICDDSGCSLWIQRLISNSYLFALMGTAVVITQDYIDRLDDDVVFRIFTKIGECFFYDYSDDINERQKGALEYAIDLAEEYSIRISNITKKEVIEEYDFDEDDFDFSNICDEITIIDLVNRYGLPLKLKMPRYYGNFYFEAEVNDVKHRMIRGRQYRNGEEYREKSYSYSEICSRYDTDDSENIDDDATADLNYNNSIKDRIKDHDGFDEVETNSDKLLNHQKAGLLLSSRYDKFAFFFDTGTGKTVMTLSIIKKKYQEEDAHFLILAPKAIIKTAWLEDSQEYFPDLRIIPLSNNFSFYDCKPLYDRWKKYKSIPKECRITKKEWDMAYTEIDYNRPDWEAMINKRWKMQNSILERMLELADHYIVNIEKFRYDPDAIIDTFDVNGLIVDESAILKNPDSKSAQTLFTYADDFDYIYLLSGKPAPNNSTEFYAQMKLVDPNTFNMSFSKFKKKYFTGSGSKTAPISAKAEDDVANMVAIRSLIVSKEDCLQLPEIYQEIRTFSLPSEIMEQYDRLYEFCIFSLQDNEKNKTGVYYSSVCRLAVFTKLREIASGFLIDEYGAIAELHDLKTRTLLEIVEEHPEEQIIIWCQFEYEIKQVEKALAQFGRVVTAYGKTGNIDESIRLFKNGDAKYIIAHPKSIKYGVTFVNCNLAVYYAMSYSAEDYYQSRDRIHRLGQKRMCTYYFIQAQNTIDEIMYEAVEKKMSYAEIFAVIVKQAAKHGINYQDFKDLSITPVKDELISTQIVKDKYDFEIIDDIQFSYKYNRQTYETTLYNTLLKDVESLRPEEILFEIGYASKVEGELEKAAEEDKGNCTITYNNVIDVAKWVIAEMSQLNIKRIQKVYDYLEEQIQKQYELDIANGGNELDDLNVLALRRPSRKKKDASGEVDKRRFKFGQIGDGKKVKTSLMDVRREVDEVFFNSGKYRMTHKCFCGKGDVAHCHPLLGLIYQDKSDYENPTPEALFDLLHEIGHLETNTEGMTRQEEEFFATKWALERMKLYNFKLSPRRQKEFDDYINGYSSRNNKILTNKNATDLDWES